MLIRILLISILITHITVINSTETPSSKEISTLYNETTISIGNPIFQETFRKLATNATSISKRILSKSLLNVQHITSFVLNENNMFIIDPDNQIPDNNTTDLIHKCIKELRLKNPDGAVKIFSVIHDIKYIPEIIQESFNITNIRSIIKFIEKLIFTISDSYALGYYKLFEEINNNANGTDRYEFFIFAFSMKNAIDAKKCISIDCQIYIIYLLENLPEIVPLIIWSQEVHLKSVYFDEYLVSESGKKQKRIYTKTMKSPDGDHVVDDNFTWVFEPIEEGRMIKLKHVKTNEYVSNLNSVSGLRCSEIGLDSLRESISWIVYTVNDNVFELCLIQIGYFMRPLYQFAGFTGDRSVCLAPRIHRKILSEITEWRIEAI